MLSFNFTTGALQVSLQDDKFKLIYGEDAHEIKAFKYSNSDSLLVSELELKVEDAVLKFSQKFTTEIGEKLNGYLTFISPTYFVDSNYRGYSRESELVKGVTRGSIYFTCKVREPFEPPKE